MTVCIDGEGVCEQSLRWVCCPLSPSSRNRKTSELPRRQRGQSRGRSIWLELSQWLSLDALGPTELELRHQTSPSSRKSHPTLTDHVTRRRIPGGMSADASAAPIQAGILSVDRYGLHEQSLRWNRTDISPLPRNQETSEPKGRQRGRNGHAWISLKLSQWLPCNALRPAALELEL